MPKKPPPPPQMSVTESPDLQMPQIKMNMPKIRSTGVSGGPFMGGVGGGMSTEENAELIPLVRIAPRYPRKAAMAGTEGWVKLAFTVTKVGTVKDVQVIETDKKVYIIKEAGQNRKTETLLDKTAGFMPRKWVYSVDDIVQIETQCEGKVLVDGIYLPTSITRKTFNNSADSPRVFRYYKNITWEKASPEEFESKLSFSFPEGTIMARKP